MTPLADRQKVRRYVHSFRHNTGLGQTERQNWENNIALCVHCMLTRDKNYKRVIYFGQLCRSTSIFIARHQAMHAERDIVMANPSVRLSVCMSDQCSYCI